MQLSSKPYIRSLSIIGAVLAAFVLVPRAAVGNSEKDPHRPQCSGPRCKRIKSFLKKRYCGQSPFGNGPDDGCEIRPPKKPRSGVDVSADFECGWNQTKQVGECHQHGQPSAAVRGIVLRELHRLGLATKKDKDVMFAEWKPTSSGWSLAQGSYSRIVRSALRLCEVIVVIDSESHVTVLRSVRFQETDADVPTVTTWSLIDIADVDSDNSPDIILEGDAYENHWLEVARLSGSSWETVFSGLGYYL